MMKLPSLVVALLLSLAPFASAQTYRPAEPRTIVPVFGLNTHERYDTREIPALADTGARMIRFHYSWKEVEKTKGVYDLPHTAYEFMRTLQANDLELLAILAYGNEHYDTREIEDSFASYDGQGAEWRQAFGDYAAWMAQTFGSRGTGQIRYWEIWNEENAGKNPEDYVDLLKIAAERIKEQDPEAKIVFGGTSRIPMDFLSACLDLGAGAYVDAIAIHPYRESTFPETSSSR